MKTFTREQILDMALADGDPMDLVGYASEHANLYALVVLGMDAVRSDLAPEGFDDNQRVLLEVDARDLLEDWIEYSLEPETTWHDIKPFIKPNYHYVVCFICDDGEQGEVTVSVVSQTDIVEAAFAEANERGLKPASIESMELM